MFWSLRLSMLKPAWPAVPMKPMFSLSLADSLRPARLMNGRPRDMPARPAAVWRMNRRRVREEFMGSALGSLMDPLEVDVSGPRSQLLQPHVAEGHGIVVPGKAEGAAGAVFARMRGAG